MDQALDIPSRAQAIRDHRAAGGRIAAVFPIHSPRALLRAHGFLPVEVWGPARVDTSLAAGHLQPYICSVVRNGLALLLGGGLDVAELILVPHSCDSLQGLGSLLIDFVRPAPPVATLYVPRAARPDDVDFLAQELRALDARLAAVSGLHPDAEALRASVAREEAADARLAGLLAARRHLPLDEATFYRAVRAREYLPAERFCELADAALAQRTAEPRAGLPLLISGIVPEPSRFLDEVGRVGACLVADDLACAGRRAYPRGERSEPLARLAWSIVHGPPDPMRGTPIADRVAHLVRLAEARGARGVLFYLVKFCEPELFDLPLLRAGLERAGLPSLTIEVELGEQLPGQAVTRLEAFVEMLGGA